MENLKTALLHVRAVAFFFLTCHMFLIMFNFRELSNVLCMLSIPLGIIGLVCTYLARKL